MSRAIVPLEAVLVGAVRSPAIPAGRWSRASCSHRPGWSPRSHLRQWQNPHRPSPWSPPSPPTRTPRNRATTPCRDLWLSHRPGRALQKSPRLCPPPASRHPRRAPPKIRRLRPLTASGHPRRVSQRSLRPRPRPPAASRHRRHRRHQLSERRRCLHLRSHPRHRVLRKRHVPPPPRRRRRPPQSLGWRARASYPSHRD